MYKALVSFSGLISMAMGEVRDIPDKSVVKDLLKAGYIMELKADKPKGEPEVKTSKARKEKKK